MSQAQVATPLRSQANDTQRKRGQLDTSGGPPAKKSIVTQAWWKLKSWMPWRNRDAADDGEDERVVTVGDEDEERDEDEDEEEEGDEILLVDEVGEEEDGLDESDEDQQEEGVNVENGDGRDARRPNPFQALNVHTVSEVVTMGATDDEEHVIRREVREQEVLVVETPDKTTVYTRRISPPTKTTDATDVVSVHSVQQAGPSPAHDASADSDPEIVEVCPTAPSCSSVATSGQPSRILAGLSPEVTNRVMEYVTEQSSRVVLTAQHASLHSPSQSSTASADRERLRVAEGLDDTRGDSPAPEDSASRQVTPRSTTGASGGERNGYAGGFKRDAWRKGAKRERGDPYRLVGRSRVIGRNNGASSSSALGKKTSETLRTLNSHRNHGDGNYDERAKQRYMEIMAELAARQSAASTASSLGTNPNGPAKTPLPFTFTTSTLNTRQKLGLEDHKKRLEVGKSMALSVLDEMFPPRRGRPQAQDTIPEETAEQQDAAGPSSSSSSSRGVSGTQQLDDSSVGSHLSDFSLANCSTISYHSVDKLADLQAQIHELSLISTSGRLQYDLYDSSRNDFARTLARLDEEGNIRTAHRLETERLHAIDVRKRLELQGIVVPEPEKAVDEFPELSEEAEALCARAWTRGPDEERFRAGDPPLTRKDLRTLYGLSWLNDEVILAYLNLIMDRSQKDKNLPKVYAFNTFFYGNISNRAKGFATVKRWTRKVDIFAHDILLIPVHLSVHWTMAVVDVAAQTIHFYDSMSGMGKHPEVAEHIMAYLEAESMDKRKRPLDASEWERVQLYDIPQQQNGSDCGVFACKFADFAARRAPPTFSQAHMPYYRKRMVYQLCESDLAAH